MTNTTRQEEIRAIHKKHRLFYELLGGFVLLLIGIFIGAMFFGGGNQDYHMNLFTEGMGIVATVIIINRWYVHRDRERLKRRLVREAGSRSNDIARSAIGQLHDEGWLEGDDGLLREANLSGANWENMKGLHRANLQGAKLESANLKKASLSEVNLQEANLFYANLENVYLSRANLQEANLSYANLKNALLGNANLQGVDISGADLQGTRLHRANLQGANMISTDLQGAHLYKANLQKVDLSYADLRETKWLGTANLEGAQLCMADLQGVDLLGTNLQKANLLGANLRGAHIRFLEIRTAWEGSPNDIHVSPVTALQGAILPNGERYTKETNPPMILKFTEPIHSKFSKTVKEINRIRRSVKQDDLPES